MVTVVEQFDATYIPSKYRHLHQGATHATKLMRKCLAEMEFCVNHPGHGPCLQAIHDEHAAGVSDAVCKDTVRQGDRCEIKLDGTVKSLLRDPLVARVRAVLTAMLASCRADRARAAKQAPAPAPAPAPSRRTSALDPALDALYAPLVAARAAKQAPTPSRRTSALDPALDARYAHLVALRSVANNKMRG